MSMLELALMPAGLLVVASVVLTAWRMLRGPGLADRAVALDLLGLLAVTATGLIVLATGHLPLLDVALGLGLVGFISAIALASFIEGAATRSARSPRDD